MRCPEWPLGHMRPTPHSRSPTLHAQAHIAASTCSMLGEHRGVAASPQPHSWEWFSTGCNGQGSSPGQPPISLRWWALSLQPTRLPQPREASGEMANLQSMFCYGATWWEVLVSLLSDIQGTGTPQFPSTTASCIKSPPSLM